jgi:molybdopterin-guanine dinucleotide biosynthesis protein A
VKDDNTIHIAVILVGGRSSRMGTDKFLLELNGQPQWSFMLTELKGFFDEVYISCRPDQKHHFPNCKLVTDMIADIGPMGAIYSAFQQIPHAENIFFVSCDLPHFKAEIAEKLYSNMDISVDVCAAQSTDKKYPEPLVAIWNKRVLPILGERIADEDYALFKCMKALHVQTVHVADELLKNVNSEADL